MPKLKQSVSVEKNKMLTALIKKQMSLKDMSVNELALKVRVRPQTLRNKIKRPETFVLGELRDCIKVLQFSPEEILQSI